MEKLWITGYLSRIVAKVDRPPRYDQKLDESGVKLQTNTQVKPNNEVVCLDDTTQMTP